PPAGELVLDVEHPEAPAGRQHVRHKVEHPNLVRSMRLLQRRTRAERALAATTPANGKPFLSIEPIDLLQVHRPPPALRHLAHPSVSGAGRPIWVSGRRTPSLPIC